MDNEVSGIFKAVGGRHRDRPDNKKPSTPESLEGKIKFLELN